MDNWDVFGGGIVGKFNSPYPAKWDKLITNLILFVWVTNLINVDFFHEIWSSPFPHPAFCVGLFVCMSVLCVSVCVCVYSNLMYKNINKNTKVVFWVALELLALQESLFNNPPQLPSYLSFPNVVRIYEQSLKILFKISCHTQAIVQC